MTTRNETLHENKQETAQNLSGTAMAWWTELAICLVFSLVIASALLVVQGDLQGEFNGHADEPAHYVTGLLVRDYVATAFPGHPHTYAREYYLHYPKVAFGQWPPVFYLVQAFWTLIFPSSHTSLLLLMALITAIQSALVYMAVRSWVGKGGALALAATMVCVAAVSKTTGMVMGDMTGSVFAFCAALLFARYLEHGRTADSVWFGFFSCLAILTRSSGFALVLIPPIAVLLTHRLDLCRRVSFWIPAVMVILICGPWQVMTANAVAGTFELEFGLPFVVRAAPRYLSALWQATGPIIALLFFAGLTATIAIPLFRKRPVEPLWACMAALAAAGYLFASVVPAGIEFRYVVGVIPAILVVAAGGFAALRREVQSLWPRYGTAAAMIVLAVTPLWLLVKAWTTPARNTSGFGAAAKSLAFDPGAKDARFLVCSGAQGEGVFVAAMAMYDQRPGHYVLRASKVLSTQDWNGRDYKSRFETPDEVSAYLGRLRVHSVVLNTTAIPLERPHHRLLLEALRTHPESWKQVGYFAPARECRECGAAVYRHIDAAGEKGKSDDLDVDRMISRPPLFSAPQP